MSRLVLAAAPLLFSLAATGASLDLVPDAVLGKPDFTTSGNLTPTAINIVSPAAIAEDPVTGALWVAESGASRVLRFSSIGAFTNGAAANLVLGQASLLLASECNRGGAVAANTLCRPLGLAVNQAGQVYVSDTSNSRVLVFHPPFSNGMAASAVLGQADFTSNSSNRGGAVSGGTLNFPRGIGIAANGDLFVADRDNNRVLRFAGNSQTGATANKVFGQPDFFTGTEANGLSATSVTRPVDAKVDGAGNLWVVEEVTPRVTRFDAGAGSGDTVADLVLCQPDFTSFDIGITASYCYQAVGVAVDASGAVYVADSILNRILRFTTLSNGAAATAVIGQASFTAGACNRGAGTPGADTLCGPFQPNIDRAGNLLVADRGNGRVLRFDQPRNRPLPAIAGLSPSTLPVGGGAFTLAVNGAGFHGDSVVNWNGSPRPTQYLSPNRLLAGIAAGDIANAGPYAVTVTSPGPGGGTSALVTLTTYVRAPLDAVADRVLGQPNFTTDLDAGRVGEELVGDINAATLPRSSLRGIAIDPRSGRLFVSNFNAGRRVMSWPSAAEFHNGQSADVIIGQQDEFGERCGPGVAISASTLCSVSDLAVDAAGALYVSDASYNRVLKFVPPFTTGMAASRVFGQGGSFSTGIANNGGIGPLSLSLPGGLAVGASGLFVHDTGNSRILHYPDPDASFTAAAAIGQPNLATGTASTPTNRRIGDQRGGMRLDAAGNLFFVDSANHRVLRFPPPFATNMLADRVIGQASFLASATATTATGLKFPQDLAFDPAGNLLVADANNNRILRYVAPFSSGMAATGVLGQSDFVTAATGTSATRFSSPMGLEVDNVGNVYMSENGNGRLLAFDRPFAFAIDPAGDIDRDGIPNYVEPLEGRDTYAKDNDVFANTRLFAMQQYRDFLSREGDAGGIAYWIGQLAGPQTRAQAIQGFFTSPEFQGVIAPVARLYFANFLRYPDYDGLQFHVARSRTGTALDVIANDFATSPEFISRYGALTNDAFIELVYQNVLGRPSDPGGKAFWLSQMAGGFTRGQVMLGFSESPEYVAAIGNEVFITMMYVGMLRRAPDPVGFSYWLTQLDGGTSSLALTQGFLEAPEYRGRFLP